MALRHPTEPAILHREARVFVGWLSPRICRCAKRGAVTASTANNNFYMTTNPVTLTLVK